MILTVCLCLRVSAGHENCSCCAVPLEASSRPFRHSQAGSRSCIAFGGDKKLLRV